MANRGFADILVIYPSHDDVEPDLWVAHSVRTDQVGVGHDPVEAVRELAIAVRTLFEEAHKDARVLIEQPAPVEVLKKMAGGEPLPEPMWERMKAAIEACIHHDPDYWSDGDDEAPEWVESTFYHEVHESDLCLT